jgi:manganese/zinc/iron transport system permease protein
MIPQLEIQIIAVVTAVACALPGVFMVLRKTSMMADSITHTILLGIVLAFFITRDLTSPLLLIGATIMGVITVWATEALSRTSLLSGDAAIGVVFPFLSSIAIILITRYAGSVHLDTDSVLLGELTFAPFDRMLIAGIDIGAKGMYIAGVLVFINLTIIIIFFKELKIATFDPILATVLGFVPSLVHYGLMTLVSLTTVGVFQIVGSILVVAFMIGPPVAAYLLTDDLKCMLILSGFIGAISAVCGYKIAEILDVSIAGSIAVIIGVIFLLVFVFAPHRGLISSLLRRRNQKIKFAKMTLIFHLYNHEGDKNEKIEAGLNTIQEHLQWDIDFMRNIIDLLKKEDSIEFVDGMIKLTEKGRLNVSKYEELFFK